MSSYVLNKTRGKTHSKEEHNAPTPTHKRIEETCIYTLLTTEDSSFLIKKFLTLDDGHIGRNM
jgi:hypothetical protein